MKVRRVRNDSQSRPLVLCQCQLSNSRAFSRYCETSRRFVEALLVTSGVDFGRRMFDLRHGLPN